MGPITTKADVIFDETRKLITQAIVHARKSTGRVSKRSYLDAVESDEDSDEPLGDARTSVFKKYPVLNISVLDYPLTVVNLKRPLALQVRDQTTKFIREVALVEMRKAHSQTIATITPQRQPHLFSRAMSP